MRLRGFGILFLIFTISSVLIGYAKTPSNATNLSNAVGTQLTANASQYVDDWDKPIGDDWDKPIGDDWDKPIGDDWDKPIGDDWDKPIGDDWDKPVESEPRTEWWYTIEGYTFYTSHNIERWIDRNQEVLVFDLDGMAKDIFGDKAYVEGANIILSEGKYSVLSFNNGFPTNDITTPTMDGETVPFFSADGIVEIYDFGDDAWGLDEYEPFYYLGDSGVAVDFEVIAVAVYACEKWAAGDWDYAFDDFEDNFRMHVEIDWYAFNEYEDYLARATYVAEENLGTGNYRHEIDGIVFYTEHNIEQYVDRSHKYPILDLNRMIKDIFGEEAYASDGIVTFPTEVGVFTVYYNNGDLTGNTWSQAGDGYYPYFSSGARGIYDMGNGEPEYYMPYYFIDYPNSNKTTDYELIEISLYVYERWAAGDFSNPFVLFHNNSRFLVID